MEMKLIIDLLLLIVCLKSCFTFYADQITTLPGLSSNISFRQFSGYLNTGNGRHYHYWFVESQSKPKTDPVILWLNGGPGVSSLEGFWLENGPFYVDTDGKTVGKDPNSWNRLANVLYLESPAFVGYSWDEHNSAVYSDDSTAEDNLLALEKFFEKFPQLCNNSFYITGESYAGVYIPMLALKMYSTNSKINLKGLAIGNGALDFNDFFSSSVKMAYTHGIIDSIEYNNLVENCCECSIKGQVCNFHNKTSKLCNPYKQIISLVHKNEINPFNIYKNCDHRRLNSKNSPINQALSHYYGIDFNEIEYNSDNRRPDCENDGYINYMRSEVVRKAIHIPDHVPVWGTSYGNYKMQYPSMKSRIQELIEKHKMPKLLIYNGDIDMVCDFLGNQRFVDELGFKLKEPYKKYTVDGRTAGFVKRYEGISFITVRDSGHMVPTDQPEAGLAIIKELVGIQNLA